MVYEFNLLVSCRWGASGRAIAEARKILNMLGDEEPEISRTIAQGIIGVRTKLDPREVTAKLRKAFSEDPFIVRETLKWTPIDTWTISELPEMKKTVEKMVKNIKENETWRMTVEKRRYTKYHKAEIIQTLAEVVDRRVDLEKPDKILLIEIIGRNAGISLLRPDEVFSSTKPY